MRNLVQLLPPLVLPILSFFILTPSLIHAKSVIEPCSSSDSCTSLLSYILPWDSKISEIASRFQVNISDILAANSINPEIPSLGNQILRANSHVKVPISCPCVDGIRRSMSTTYRVQEADTAESVSHGYGGIVSAEQITIVNGINASNPLLNRQSLVIPLPCTCFNNSNNGVTTVYMSYVVQSGENLSSIGLEFGTTVMDLKAINGLGQPVIDQGDILAIPISACSSKNLNWYNESLIVPNGSYALTANNCIKCNCGASDFNLQCFPSGIAVPCSHLQCKGSNLFVGDAYVNQTAAGCNVSTCMYRGHCGGKIFRSLSSSSYVQCPGKQNYSAASPLGSPSSPNPLIPFITVTPSPSPFPGSTRTVGIASFGPTSTQYSNISNNGGLLGKDSCCNLLLLALALYYFL
ncbi:lysM domain-containing GPI-anchored protein 1-like [Quercus robur]|uniref:lysM domain-containing GPI-anchored protein 1-like n=1 Tax=Quercus robur TaxID=38942 RepID=UPI002161803E|nr:lysM domain-containing GPI-anchored protein 1-like [Quercus robur]